MADTNRLRVFYLLHLSKPLHNRPIYQAIARRGVKSIVELGVGTGQRAMRMIEVAARRTPAGQIRYTGVDLFEARSPRDTQGMPLKMAHRLLQATGAQIRLVPGDPFAALARSANCLGPTDLVIISHELDPALLAPAWFYLPRILHAGSHVLTEHRDAVGGVRIQEVPCEEVSRLAAVAARRRAA